jgi:pyruvate ferredoxin oxidoreductase alpha subunit
MPYEVPDQSQVDAFLPPYEYQHKLGPEKPTSLNTVTLPGGRPDLDGNFAPGYMEIRRCLHVELKEAIEVHSQVEADFQTMFGRGGNPMGERYRCDDADYVVVALGSMANQIMDAVDGLRDEGLKAGLLALTLYRPFPSDFIASELSRRKGVIVFEKALSPGNTGALFGDIRAALYGCESRPFLRNFILGLGGRNYKTSDFFSAIRESVQNGSEQTDDPGWIGLGR